MHDHSFSIEPIDDDGKKLLQQIQTDLKTKYDGDGNGIITKEEATKTWMQHPDYKSKDEL